MSDYTFLKPFTFKNQPITLKNRIVIPPMTTRLSFEDGTVTQDEIEYYQKRAGGVGLFITGTANVNPLGKGFEGELSVADDRFIPGLSRLATAMKTGGSKAVLQIFSAGGMSNSKIFAGSNPSVPVRLPRLVLVMKRREPSQLKKLKQPFTISVRQCAGQSKPVLTAWSCTALTPI